MTVVVAAAAAAADVARGSMMISMGPRFGTTIGLHRHGEDRTTMEMALHAITMLVPRKEVSWTSQDLMPMSGGEAEALAGETGIVRLESAILTTGEENIDGEILFFDSDEGILSSF
jgi:hypothetical protein